MNPSKYHDKIENGSTANLMELYIFGEKNLREFTELQFAKKEILN
jgi:hypothetical protein